MAWSLAHTCQMHSLKNVLMLSKQHTTQRGDAWKFLRSFHHSYYLLHFALCTLYYATARRGWHYTCQKICLKTLSFSYCMGGALAADCTCLKAFEASSTFHTGEELQVLIPAICIHIEI